MALRLGYRHIDTATLYGNEAFIGDALKKLRVGGVGGNPKEPTGELGLNREDLFLTSKAILFWTTLYIHEIRQLITFSFNI